MQMTRCQVRCLQKVLLFPIMWKGVGRELEGIPTVIVSSYHHVYDDLQVCS